MSELQYIPANFRRQFVQGAADLHEVVAELQQSNSLGVDLEMGQRVQRFPGGRQEWTHILALIQIASDTLSVVIDPLRCGSLDPLRPLMAGPIRKVFLGGGQDVALLARSGIPARNIVDVGEVALGIFGRREDGMAALAHRIFGLSLDKTIRRADWMVRPLNPTLVSYAYRDAELTLLIYRWFQSEYPEVVRLHERALLDPPLPTGTPEWLALAVTKPSADALATVMASGIDPDKNQEALAAPIREALRDLHAPRLVNRLLRIAADLGVKGLVPDILPMVSSHSSLIRGSAARALGVLATAEEAEGPLQSLTQDPIEDVRKAAAASLKELRSPASKSAPTKVDEEAPSLDDAALQALRKLLDESN